MMRRLWAMTVVEAKLFLREPLTVVFVLVLPLAVLLVLNGIFGNVPDEYFAGLGAIDFYTPAYVSLVVATIGVLTVPVQVAGYREHGVLRRFRASPMPMGVLLAAQVLVAVGLGMATSILMVVVSTAVYGGAAPVNWPGVVAAFLLIAASFATVGVLLGLVLPTARAAQGVGVLLFFLFMNLGGAGPPPELLPDVMGAIGTYVPLTLASDLLRGPWLGQAIDVTAALAIVGMAIVGMVLTSWRLRAEGAQG